MPSIGSFGVAARDAEGEPVTFEFCGETFTVGQPSVITLGKFAQAAMSGADTAEMEGLAALIGVVGQCVVDEDRDRFLSVAEKNRAEAEDLLDIMRAIMEYRSGHPTQRPSDSSGGPSTTGPSSKAPSSSEVSSIQKWQDTPFGRRELAAHPDLYADVKPISEAASAILAG